MDPVRVDHVLISAEDSPPERIAERTSKGEPSVVWPADIGKAGGHIWYCRHLVADAAFTSLFRFIIDRAWNLRVGGNFAEVLFNGLLNFSTFDIANNNDYCVGRL